MTTVLGISGSSSFSLPKLMTSPGGKVAVCAIVGLMLAQCKTAEAFNPAVILAAPLLTPLGALVLGGGFVAATWFMRPKQPLPDTFGRPRQHRPDASIAAWAFL